MRSDWRSWRRPRRRARGRPTCSRCCARTRSTQRCWRQPRALMLVWPPAPSPERIGLFNTDCCMSVSCRWSPRANTCGWSTSGGWMKLQVALGWAVHVGGPPLSMMGAMGVKHRLWFRPSTHRPGHLVALQRRLRLRSGVNSGMYSMHKVFCVAPRAGAGHRAKSGRGTCDSVRCRVGWKLRRRCTTLLKPRSWRRHRMRCTWLPPWARPTLKPGRGVLACACVRRFCRR